MASTDKLDKLAGNGNNRKSLDTAIDAAMESDGIFDGARKGVDIRPAANGFIVTKANGDEFVGSDLDDVVEVVTNHFTAKK